MWNHELFPNLCGCSVVRECRSNMLGCPLAWVAFHVRTSIRVVHKKPEKNNLKISTFCFSRIVVCVRYTR